MLGVLSRFSYISYTLGMFPAFGREIRLGLMYTGGKAIWSFCWSEGMNSAGIVVSSAGVTAVVESGWL